MHAAILSEKMSSVLTEHFSMLAVKALARLHRCAGLPEPSLVTYVNYLCNGAGSVESYLVTRSEVRIFRDDKTHIIYVALKPDQLHEGSVVDLDTEIQE